MLDNIDSYSFEDLFDMQEIQELVDTMSRALNMGLVIVSPDGKWITRPSSRCFFCEEVIKKSEKGFSNCKLSDSVLGKPNQEGPIIEKCLSAGLMDAGISIFIKEKHIASWIIGQVRTDSGFMNEEEIITKADELGIESELYRDALSRVPVMTMERFTDIANMVNKIAVQLSELGYRNYLQKEEIRKWESSERQLKMESKWYEYIANHDSLTGLFSRAYFDDKVCEVMSRKTNPTTYMICDINNLKVANDAFGHEKGDELLKTAASILDEEAKNSDYIIARCGGDEINILMPGADEQEAAEYMVRVQKHCSECRDCVIPVSLAIGYCRMDWTSDNYQEAMVRADERMYDNKREIKGRQDMLSEIMNMLYDKGYLLKDNVDATARLAGEFARYLGISDNIIERIVYTAKIQDIGMIAVPEGAFNKHVGGYKHEERAGLDRHTLTGCELARMYPESQPVAKIILQTHECFDGSGYPNGIKGERIMLEARILYLVNTYVTWSTKSDPLLFYNETDAAENIKARAGSQFDPMLVEKFVGFLQEREAERNVNSAV